MKTYKAGDEIRCYMPQDGSEVVVDIADGLVKGTASTPSIDLQGHRVLAGAFDDSIKTRGFKRSTGVRLLMHHDREKVAGLIHKLETVDSKLRIEAQLNLNVSYVKDFYEIAKQTEGLNFSVGFRLQDFRFVEDEATKLEVLEVQKGDLMEVSMVTFPAQLEATMDYVKSETPSEFEKTLIKEGIALNRSQAHKLMKLVKRSIHLFGAPMPVPPEESDHPMLDAHQLKAATDLLARARASLGTH